MVQSMTGFGRASVERDGRMIIVELKSVNHRFLDLSFRMPRHIGFIEDSLRSCIKDRVARGHIDVSVSYRNTRCDAKTVEIDEALLVAYVNAAEKVSVDHNIEYDLKISNILRLPDVTNVIEADEDSDVIIEIAKETVNMAIDSLKAMRESEGERLAKDLLVRVDTIANIRDNIALRAPYVVEEYQQKLNERIEQLIESKELIDKQRLATEVALFADKASIDEELVRLKSHFEHMRNVLNSSVPVGRELDFIVQEVNREFNTIGSKANDEEIAHNVIMGKNEVEKIREQVQNIE